MDADDLYGLPLEEFVSQRGALAKALRAEKRRDKASEVAALRKPSIAAWAVNQLVRTQRDSVQALFHAGDGLQRAQHDLLAGSGDGRKLRAAGERERAAVDELVEAARGLLTSGGYELSVAVIERVDETLHAAALNEEARNQVRDGRLERELRHVGLGLGLGEAIAATPTPRATKAAPGSTDTAPSKGGAGSQRAAASRKRGGSKGTTEQERAEAKRAADEERDGEKRLAQAQREEAERAERERATARKAARAAETAARRRADAAARALEKAQRRRETAAQALQEADDALAEARGDAEAATAEHERAQAALDDL